MMTSLIMSIFEKLCEKWLKYVFFLKLTFSRFSGSFSASESQETYKLNIYRLVC